MSINWIPVGTRVPDSRRPVLTWGHTLMHSRPEGRFLGVAKCNIGRNGHRFDNEVSGFLPATRVTHWADIESPPYTPPKLPAPHGVKGGTDA